MIVVITAAFSKQYKLHIRIMFLEMKETSLLIFNALK